MNPGIDLVTADPQAVCMGSATQLEVLTSAYGPGTQTLHFFKDSVVPVPDNSFAGALSPLQVSGTNMSAGDIYSVTIDSLKSPYTSDLAIFLIAPDGSSVELSSNNGADGDNYVGTTLAMWAISPITIASPPFTGEFIPEGDLTALTGASDGTWKLKVADVVAGNLDTLFKWSMTFKTNAINTYHWWPASGLSDTAVADPLATPVSDTRYYVQVEDEWGCESVTDSVDITVKPLPTATLSLAENTICQGEEAEVSLNLTGTGPWLLHGLSILENGQSPVVFPDTLVPGPVFTFTDFPMNDAWYMITSYTDQGNACLSDTANWIMVDVLPLPVIQLGNDTTLCADHSLLLDAGNPGSVFLWSDSSTGPTLMADSAGYGYGTHTFWVNVDNGCVNRDTIHITFDPCTGFHETELQVKIFPNPNSGSLFIDIMPASAPVTFRIIDTRGATLYNGVLSAMNSPSSGLFQIDTRPINPGLYYLLLEYDGQKRILKFVRE